MKSIYIFLIFILVVLVQLFVPAKMIFNQEHIMANGAAYKFKTQPIDPSNPFKGKYIYLNYDLNSAPSKDTTWTTSTTIYVTIITDSLGFAKVKDVSKEDPKEGDYIKSKVD